MLSSKSLEKKLQAITQSTFIKRWKTLGEGIREHARKQSLESAYLTFQNKILKLIQDFKLIPDPRTIWDYLILGNIPFKIKRNLEGHIMTKSEWLEEEKANEERLGRNQVDEREQIRKDWHRKGAMTSLGRQSKAFVLVERHEIHGKKFYWFAQKSLKEKELSSFKANDLLLWLYPEIQKSISMLEIPKLNMLNLTEFATFSLPEIHLFYTVKEYHETAERQWYMLANICPFDGKCTEGTECPDPQQCKVKRSLSSHYKPVALIGERWKSYWLFEDRRDEILKKIREEVLQKNPELTEKGWDEIFGKWYEMTQEDHKRPEEIKKKVYGKDQKIWCFQSSKEEIAESQFVVKVLVQPAKPMEYLDNIFSLPPIASYSRAKNMLHDKVSFARITPFSKSETIKKDSKKFEDIQKEVEKEWGSLTSEERLIAESNCFLVPLTPKCCIKTTQKYWPFIQTRQALYTGRKKGVTPYTEYIGKLLEGYSEGQNGESIEVTLKSIRDNIDAINKRIYATIISHKPSKRKRSSKRKRLASEDRRAVLPLLCAEIQEAVVSSLEGKPQRFLQVHGDEYKVIKVCTSSEVCKWKYCPFKNKGSSISIEAFSMTEDQLLRVYKRYKKG